MSYVALAAAVIGAGTAVYQGVQKSKAAKAAAASTAGAGAGAGAAFGHIPKAAKYQPIDFQSTQLDTIRNNTNALPDISKLVFGENNLISDDALARAKKLIPGYSSAISTYGQAGNDLLNGRLPFSDVADIVSKRGELTNSLGVPGTGTNATLKDLGLSQLDAIKAGGGILKDMVSIAEGISPVNRYATPQSSLLDPSQAIQLGMQQNQLIQQSEQSANNLKASGSPAAAFQLQLALAQAGRSTGAAGGATPDYGSIANSLITSGVKAYQSTGWGGNTGTVAGASPSYYDSKPAYYNGTVVPRATAA